jgi:Uma2 family endonuclease
MAVRTMTTPNSFLLQNGDRLSRDEFERRYHMMPNVKKAELIDAVVHMPSPVSFRYHGQQEAHLSLAINYYVAMTEGTYATGNTTVRLDLDNEPQPDYTLFIDPDCGGRVVIDADGYLEGAPDLVAEVSGSSVTFDLGKKLDVYRRNGVREYVVWRVFDEAIDWFVLHEGQFTIHKPDAAGVVESLAFPGLHLDTKAMLAGDTKAVLSRLNAGLATAAHAEFVARLAAAKK